MKSSIQLVTQEFYPFHGGVGLYCQEIAQALKLQGVDIEVEAPHYHKPLSDSFAFPVIRFNHGGTFQPLDMIRLIIWMAGRRKIYQRKTVLLPGRASLMAAMFLTGFGLFPAENAVCVFHGTEVLRFSQSGFWKCCARKFFPKTQAVLAASPYVKVLMEESFLAECMPKEIQVAPCAVRTSLKEAAKTISHETHSPLRILTLARIHPRKGQLDTAKILSLLSYELKQRIVYQIAGRGDANYLEQVKVVCAEGGVKLEVLGEIANEDLAKVYEQCDLYMMNSRTLAGKQSSVEGFGMSYLEASLFGKPVIGYRSGGVAAAVLHSETGFLADEGNEQEAVGFVERLIHDADLRKRMGEKGREYALSFDWNKAAQVILKI
jgi:glycosyltransferase involved in cell wall biosynthesis